MKPYYEDDLVTLYHGDCREVTDWLAGDVLVTDPPYGTQAGDGYLTDSFKRSGPTEDHKRIAGDADTRARDAALAAWGDRPSIIFGSALKTPPYGAVQQLAYVKPPDAGAVASRAGWRRDVEIVFLCGPWAIGAPKRSSVLRTGARSMGNPFGVAARSGGHPHAKPIDVMEALIASCPPGVIADRFAGSGSTLVASKGVGRRAIGVELDERYCEIAAKRLAQDTLFGGIGV